MCELTFKQFSRGCILCLQYGGKLGPATPPCLRSSVAFVDKCKSWLSGNRTNASLSFRSLACVMKFFLRILQNNLPSSIQMDGQCVKSTECILRSMTFFVRYLLVTTNKMQNILIFYFYRFSTCFKRFLRPSSGAKKLYIQLHILSTNTAASCYRG